MKKTILACILLMVVLAGCVKVQESDNQQETSPANVQTQEKVEDKGLEAPKPKTYTLDSETQQLIEGQMTAGKDIIFPRNFQKISYGNSYVFGIGINNLQTQEDEFLITVEFDKAYDKYTNQIDVDESSMNEWVKTVFQPFILPSYEHKIFGIAMEVGDIMAGKKPSPGTYVFDVVVLHRVSPGAGVINSPYATKNQISIKVE